MVLFPLEQHLSEARSVEERRRSRLTRQPLSVLPPPRQKKEKKNLKTSATNSAVNPLKKPSTETRPSYPLKIILFTLNFHPTVRSVLFSVCRHRRGKVKFTMYFALQHLSPPFLTDCFGYFRYYF